MIQPATASVPKPSSASRGAEIFRFWLSTRARSWTCGPYPHPLSPILCIIEPRCGHPALLQHLLLPDRARLRGCGVPIKGFRARKATSRQESNNPIHDGTYQAETFRPGHWRLGKSGNSPGHSRTDQLQPRHVSTHMVHFFSSTYVYDRTVIHEAAQIIPNGILTGPEFRLVYHSVFNSV